MTKSTDDKHDAADELGSGLIVVGKLSQIRENEPGSAPKLDPLIEAAAYTEAVRTTDGPMAVRVKAGADAIRMLREELRP